MLLTEKQTDKRIEWFIKTYKDDCAVTLDGKLDIPIIYSEDPDKTELEHAEMWRKELKKLMWRSYNQEYIHRGWRKDTLWEAQFQALRLYNWPIFKHITEKENATNKHSTSRQKVLWNLFRRIRKK